MQQLGMMRPNLPQQQQMNPQALQNLGAAQLIQAQQAQAMQQQQRGPVGMQQFNTPQLVGH